MVCTIINISLELYQDNMPKPTVARLKQIAESAHVPGVSYTYVEPIEGSKREFISTPLAVGKKSTDNNDEVNNNTQFPASSLSKIVFTYLVLRLVEEQQIDLDEPLLPILQKNGQEYERFKVDGNYPEKAKQLTARQVLSHTTGLPNFGSGSEASAPLSFDNKSDLGKGYSYSGEAILYLQKVIEAKMGKDLETLAKNYVFKPLEMNHSTFLPQPDGTDIVKVHTELGKSTAIYVGEPPVNAAGSLLTTGDNFSRFMTAWLKKMDSPTFQQAFEFETSFALSDLTPEDFMRLRKADNISKYLKNTTEDNYKRVSFSKLEFDNLKQVTEESLEQEIQELSKKLVPTRGYHITETCGLGWHIYKNADNKVIAYQYGENLNTRAFMAINVTDKKGAAFFTNSEQGMSIATQILSAPDFAPIGETQALFEKMPQYPQSDKPGWKETLEGMRAENQGDVESIKEARRCFVAAIESSPDDTTKTRLEWFDLVQKFKQNIIESTPPLETFAGVYKNPFGEKREIFIKDGRLICKEFDKEIKLVRISETEFLPEKNQDFKIGIKGHQVSIQFLHSQPKYLFEESLPESNNRESFFAALSKLPSNQPIQEVQTQHADESHLKETQEAAKLESARNVNQRFRSALVEVRSDKEQPSQEKTVANHDNTPSPFQ